VPTGFCATHHDPYSALVVGSMKLELGFIADDRAGAVVLAAFASSA